MKLSKGAWIWIIEIIILIFISGGYYFYLNNFPSSQEKKSVYWRKIMSDKNISWNREIKTVLNVNFFIKNRKKIEQKPYLGVWQRVSSFQDGKEKKFNPSYLLLAENYYIMQSKCLMYGRLSVSETGMTESWDYDGCTHETAPKDYSMNYDLSENNNTLTLSSKQFGPEVKDIYVRIK